MPKGIFVKQNGTWSPVRYPTFKAGESQAIIGGWTKVNGTWQKFWPDTEVAVTITAIGGGGGGGGRDAGQGGHPGYTGDQVTWSGTIQTTDSIQIYLGGGGGGGVSNAGGAPGGAAGASSAGFPGGRGGNAGPRGASGGGGGGGGATVVAINSYAAIIAGGGGGGGGAGYYTGGYPQDGRRGGTGGQGGVAGEDKGSDGGGGGGGGGGDPGGLGGHTVNAGGGDLGGTSGYNGGYRVPAGSASVDYPGGQPLGAGDSQPGSSGLVHVQYQSSNGIPRFTGGSVSNNGGLITHTFNTSPSGSFNSAAPPGGGIDARTGAEPVLYQITNGAYCGFLNTYGVWTDGGGTQSTPFDLTYNINFGPGGNYIFEFSVDNSGEVYVDGAPVLVSTGEFGYRQSFATVAYVPPGVHALRLHGINDGGPASFGLLVNATGQAQEGGLNYSLVGI